MPPSTIAARRIHAALRIALSHYLTVGLSAALGLLVISTAVHLLAGPFAASVASVGVIVCIPPDQAAPRRGKFWQLLPAALLGLPLFLAVQALHERPLALGLLLVPATFLAFLGGAWGKRGLPIVVSAMFAMIFSMAVPTPSGGADLPGLGMHFGLGAGLYLVWATLANSLLNARYRVLMLADTLLALADLMRTQARLFPAPADQAALTGELMGQQAALADQLQAARNILLESPRTARRQQLASMLMHVLEMRDHLLACELDLDTLKARPGQSEMLGALSLMLLDLAEALQSLADALLLGRLPELARDHRPALDTLVQSTATDASAASPGGLSIGALTRSLTNRVGRLNDETRKLVAVARDASQADLTTVRTAWHMFVSPTTWSWQPLAAVWRWDAPTLRHALRAALAIGCAYALSLALPWGSHDYWILLTIVVVLRGSLAQTLERRNSRVAGTLLGCLLATGLLWGQVPHWALLGCLTLAQGIAHGFAVRKYLVTAVAATVLGLVQAHLLAAGASPVFEVVERVADTLLGAAIAWIFSYVLPSWERGQIPALVARTLAAQARHARVALGLGQLKAIDNEPELAWRLARREAYDSLSALVQATQRALSEPRAVQPPLASLERLLAHSYQLLAQLTVVKTLLLLQRGQLDRERIAEPLAQAADAVESALIGAPGALDGAGLVERGWLDLSTPPEAHTDNLEPWALRRLDLALMVAVQLRGDADEVLAALQPSVA
jgi:uncharacterized membrane protein YccC